MKKQLFKIAVEAIATISLIALLALVTALVYALLSLLSPSTPSEVSTSRLPSAVIHILPSAKAAQSTAVVSTIVEDYSAMTTRQLRPIAKARKIARWNKLNKSELIAALSA